MADRTRGTTRKALIVEDAPELQLVVRRALEEDGFAVVVAATGESAVALARSEAPDVIVLDIGLPGMSGIEVCRQVRAFSDVYVVMLTARGDEVDRLVGLSIGADDYVTKPFSARELVARVNAMLRRPRVAAETAPQLGQLVVDADTREATYGGTPLDLTRIEFDLLLALTRRPRKVIGRKQLLDEVWGADWFGDTHVVEVHISNVRRKLEAVAGHRQIRTVRGVGYRFEPSEPGS